MKKRYIFICILFLLFILNTILVFTNNYKILDDKIYYFLMNFRSGYLDEFFRIITKLVDPLNVVITIFILLIFLQKENIYRLMISVIIIISTNQLLKNILRRVRPDHLRLVDEKGFSYPSGHTMISIALYGVLIYIVYKNIKNKFIKTSLIVLLSLIILLIGISRIYLGVHYPSDVIGGYLISIPIFILISSLLTNHFRGNKNDKDSSI